MIYLHANRLYHGQVLRYNQNFWKMRKMCIRDRGGSCAFSPVVFDENGNCLDNAVVKANDILEDILIAEFDMDRIRACLLYTSITSIFDKGIVKPKCP